MANKTINDLPANTSPAHSVELEVQLTAGGNSEKVTLENLIKVAGQVFFPVGRPIMWTSTNPGNSIATGGLGFGTWVRIQGKFIVGASDSDGDFDYGDTGGAKTHTLTIAEMPSHTHTQNSHNHTQNSHRHLMTQVNIGGTRQYTAFGSEAGINGNRWSDYATATNNATTATNQNTGGGDPHNNLPPYQAEYIWKRTA